MQFGTETWQDDEETIHPILEKPPVDVQQRRPNGSASEIRTVRQSARAMKLVSCGLHRA